MPILRPRRERLEAGATDFVVRLAFLGLFAWWSLQLVSPFLPIVVWAVLLAVALYPAYAWLARRLGGRRGLAAALVTLVALATVLGPVSVLAASLAESVQWIAAGLQSGTLKVPPPPADVAGLAGRRRPGRRGLDPRRRQPRRGGASLRPGRAARRRHRARQGGRDRRATC